jgi:Protein of unknown function DUF262
MPIQLSRKMGTIMARRSKLTNNSDEAEIAGVLSGDSIFSIPYFQRPYKWKPERIRRLQEDILNVVDSLIDDAPDSHFLGAIIIHGRRYATRYFRELPIRARTRLKGSIAIDGSPFMKNFAEARETFLTLTFSPTA